MHAISTIHAEHRSLGAVLHGMLCLIREIRYTAATPDFAVFNAMAAYLETFSERFHHPKEDAYLFRALRLRDAAAASLIDRLELEHDVGAKKIRALTAALRGYEEQGRAAFATFAEAGAAFALFHYRHMRTEEDELLPLCKARLTLDDWKEIDAAFAGHTDPLFNADENARYTDLFRLIVDLAPPPIGAGRAR